LQNATRSASSAGASNSSVEGGRVLATKSRQFFQLPLLDTWFMGNLKLHNFCATGSCAVIEHPSAEHVHRREVDVSAINALTFVLHLIAWYD
jgi:hypothetical protein